MNKKVSNLRDEARQCIGLANRTVDNKVAAALLAYACELEQRARLIDNAKKSAPRGHKRIKATNLEALPQSCHRRASASQ